MLRLASVALALCCLAPSRASAHPLVDEGLQRLHDADFAGALQVFAQAEARDDLTRAELATLLAARATVNLALDDERAAAVDLRMLVELEPRHVIDATAPPELRDAFRRAVASARGALSVTASHVRDGGRVDVEATTRNDTAGLVRELRVYVRRGDGLWQAAAAGHTSIEAPPDTRVEYYAEAVGPGGAIVARTGSRPFPHTAPASNDGEAGAPPWLWIGLGIGAAVLVATVAIFVVAGSANPDTVVEGPFATD